MSHMEILLTVFIVVTAVAVVIQAGILIGMFVAIKKSMARMEALATQVQTRALPVMDTAQSMINEYRPKLDLVLDNLTGASTAVKQEIDRLQQPLQEMVERIQLQAVRVDDLLTKTLDRVEGAGEVVSETVSRPVKRATGVAYAVATGVATLFNRGNYARAKKPAATPKDEMFI
jgi:MFS superfamily sulfate permease-like transporter